MGFSSLAPSAGSVAAARARTETSARGTQYGQYSPALDLTVDLLARANQGDQSAWDLLVERHLGPLKLVARIRLPRHMRARADTDDVVQDALVRSMNHLRHFECRGRGALLAYLRRVVINRVADEIRHYTRA